MRVKNPPIGIVIPWFGSELTGGAELQAWQIAERLGRRGRSVEVLTTACRSTHDHYEENYYRPGVYREEWFTVRRFKVVKRDKKRLRKALSEIYGLPSAEFFGGCSPVSKENSAVFAEQLIRSPSLLRFLRRNKDNYSAFIFLPYLFPPILKGLPLVAEKAYLQPCLHDECYAYFPEVEDVFCKAKGLLFNSEGEYELARKLYGTKIDDKSYLVGEGVEIEPVNEEDSDKPHPVVGEAPFVLYLGKKCKEKNVDLLVDVYRQFKAQFPSSELKLVLAGVGDSYASFDSDASITDLGKISEDEKLKLIKQCRALIQPSVNESFSRVIFEAWKLGRPVAVNGRCLATQKAVERSQGGWFAESPSQWVELFAHIDGADESSLSQIGKKGEIYAQSIADWDAVMDRYEKILFLNEKKNVSLDRIEIREDYPRISIHQLSAGFAQGDAISNIATKFRDYLREHGFNSNIYVEHATKQDRKSGCVELLKRFHAHKTGVVLYHHSTDSLAAERALAFSGVKAMLYHNVTPPQLVESGDPRLAEELRKGVQRTRELVGRFDFFAAASDYNAEELRQYGVNCVTTLPCFFDLSDCKSVERVMRLGSFPITNILFVGRISSHKQQDLLVEAFSRYLRYDPRAHLYIIGGGDSSGMYYKSLLRKINALRLNDFVTFTGKVSHAELVSYYRIADLYWSFSAHEGFGIPLIEAMAFDVPVLAYSAAAVPEVMGEGGLIFNDVQDLDKVAALASILVRDRGVRSQIIAAQRENIKRFTWENSRKVFAKMINQLLDKKLGRTSVTLSN